MPDALHIGCFLNGQLIGVGSIVPEPRKHATQPTSWRIRDMAVLENMRGTGVGGKILQALIDHVSVQHVPAKIWCNGRANVKGFYERFGFSQECFKFSRTIASVYLYSLLKAVQNTIDRDLSIL